MFSWGHGGNGQLGHGTMAHQNTPRKIFELMGNSVCQVACGRRHTICLTDKQEIIGFGLNSGGQLGLLDDQNIRLPVNIGVACAAHLAPGCVAAGGDQSFCGVIETAACRPEDLKLTNIKKIKCELKDGDLELDRDLHII